MRRIALAVLLSAGLQAQTIWQVPLWTGQTYQWPKLGPSFTVKDGVLDVLPAPPTTTHRHTVGVKLTATSGTYFIPATAVNLVLYRNGIRQLVGVDYTLAAGVVMPLFPDGWATSLVVADYETP